MHKRNVTSFVSAVVLLGYMGLIFHLSSIPGTRLILPAPDYIMHGLGFGALSFLFTIFLLHYLPLSQSVGFSILLTFLYGLGDEAHQFFVPNRYSDWRDIAADLVGALVVQAGIVLFMYFCAYRKSKAQSPRLK